MKPLKQQSPLEIFKAFFGMYAHKQTTERLEYRVQNLDDCIKAANQIIKKNNLPLVAATSGNMAQIRAFEVREVSDAA